MLISRLNEIEIIHDIEKDFEKEKGVKPFNLSTWETTEQFNAYMNRCFDFDIPCDQVKYLYTYNIDSDVRRKTLEKIRGKPASAETTLIYAPNNTISIVNIVNFMKFKKGKICLIEPAYFSIGLAMESFGLNFERLQLKINKNHECSLPDFSKLLSYDAIWLTSPVFSTGQYYCEEDIEKIKKLMQSGVFILLDESFALNGFELIRKLDVDRNFIAIYSPHKSIHINALKYSAIICHKDHEDFFDQWTDVFSGNLSFSNNVAIHHFITDNYDHCSQSFNQYINNAKKETESILRKYPSICHVNYSCGNLITIYLPRVAYSLAKSRAFLREMVYKTYASIIPGYLNGFGSTFGFCFRINMSRACGEFYNSLHRLLQFFQQF